MDRRTFVFIVLSQILSLLIIAGAFLFILSSINEQSKNALKSVDERIEKIVLSTLLKVRDDIGIILPDEGASSNDENKEKKEVKLEGARLSTFEDHFYIDNVPYFKGDVVAPYGMAVAIGRDMVIFDDFNGGVLVLGKQMPNNKDIKNNNKDNNKVDNLTNV